MKKVSALLALAFALSALPARAQTTVPIAASGPSQCYGVVYPIKCHVPITLTGPNGSYYIYFTISNSTTYTLDFIDVISHNTTISSLSQHMQTTGPKFPDTVTFTFQGMLNDTEDADAVTGTVTFDLSYLKHYLNCGGRESNCIKWTASVTGVSGSLTYSD